MIYGVNEAMKRVLTSCAPTSSYHYDVKSELKFAIAYPKGLNGVLLKLASATVRMIPVLINWDMNTAMTVVDNYSLSYW